MKQAKSVFVIAAAVLAMMVSAAPLAEARSFHGGFHGGGFRHAGMHRGFVGGHRGVRVAGWRRGAAWHGGRVWRGNWRGRRVWRNGRWIAVGAFPAFYGAGYGGGCGWLYRRAINTGSSYWWSRYNACAGNW